MNEDDKLLIDALTSERTYLHELYRMNGIKRNIENCIKRCTDEKAGEISEDLNDLTSGFKESYKQIESIPTKGLDLTEYLDKRKEVIGLFRKAYRQTRRAKNDSNN